MFILLNIFWLIRTSKYVLFWVYLWQLKEYHVGRFVDHFRTDAGKKLVFSPVALVKIILLFCFVLFQNFFSLWFSILFLIYIFESLLFIRNLWFKNFKRPTATFKILFLSAALFFITLLFLGYVSSYVIDVPWASIWILVFDILLPAIISVVVLLFQPFFVFARNIILKRAAQKISRFNSAGLIVIAITGSYGKTSTKEFLTTILSKKFSVLKTSEHQNSEIGIANCILKNLRPEHQFFIAEIGAYNKGKVKEVCAALRPKIGVVTGVNEQHLALFGSMENLLSAEGGRELAEALPEDGLLVVNGDNKYCLDLYKRAKIANKQIYAATRNVVDSDIWAENVGITTNFVSLIVTNKNKELSHLKANVLGRHNVQNLLGAILVAKEMGMSFEEIADACQDIKQEQAGMTLKKGAHGLNIIDSSYSANPDGVIADLEYLSLFSEKRVVVMPCLIELGEKSAEIHQRLGRKIGEVCDMAIITTKEKFEDIKRGFDEARKEQDADILRRSQTNVAKCLLCDKPDDIFSLVTLFCKSGDAVLLEGRVPTKIINELL